MTDRAGLLVGLNRDQLDFVRGALADWLPQQAQHVVDVANSRIGRDTAWVEDDDFATGCEMLAVVARVAATLAQELANG